MGTHSRSMTRHSTPSSSAIIFADLTSSLWFEHIKCIRHKLSYKWLLKWQFCGFNCNNILLSQIHVDKTKLLSVTAVILKVLIHQKVIETGLKWGNENWAGDWRRTAPDEGLLSEIIPFPQGVDDLRLFMILSALCDFNLQQHRKTQVTFQIRLREQLYALWSVFWIWIYGPK